jgi:hypothetical protein
MKTAIQELMDVVEMDFNNGVEISMKVFYGMLMQARQKGKQQMIDTFKHAQVLHAVNDETRAEQYYTQTYNQ